MELEEQRSADQNLLSATDQAPINRKSKIFNQKINVIASRYVCFGFDTTIRQNEDQHPAGGSCAMVAFSTFFLPTRCQKKGAHTTEGLQTN